MGFATVVDEKHQRLADRCKQEDDGVDETGGEFSVSIGVAVFW